MAKEVVVFTSEEKMSRGEAVTFLRTLADRLEGGAVTLKQGEQTVDLDIPENIVLEIKAEEEEKKGGLKHSLEVEIEWRESDTQAASVELS